MVLHLDAWWVWMIAGVAMAILEVLVPVFVFLGFAIGAVATGVLVWFGLLPTGSLPAHLIVFTLLSLAAWLGLRWMFGLHHGQVKLWDKDINDN